MSGGKEGSECAVLQATWGQEPRRKRVMRQWRWQGSPQVHSISCNKQTSNRALESRIARARRVARTRVGRQQTDSPTDTPYSLCCRSLAWEPRHEDNHWAGVGLPGTPSAWRVSHLEAGRLLAHAWLVGDRMDMIDADSFGMRGDLVPQLLQCVRWGGMVYLTCTDGPMCGGKAPRRAMEELGATVLDVPGSEEAAMR